MPCLHDGRPCRRARVAIIQIKIFSKGLCFIHKELVHEISCVYKMFRFCRHARSLCTHLGISDFLLAHSRPGSH